MLAVLHVQFRVHFQYISSNVEFVKQNGYFRSPISGRIRWFGWNPMPTEIANFPVQACVSDVMNERLPRIWRHSRGEYSLYERQQFLSGLSITKKPTPIPGVKIIAQQHDAGIFECPEKQVDALKQRITEVWDEDVVLPSNGRRFKLPVDLKVATRLSDLG